MSKINYRHEVGTTSKREKLAKRTIDKLGKITTIEGYRFKSTRSSEHNEPGYLFPIRSTWTNTHEKVCIRGENGTARMDAVCWGYGGSGPHCLKYILDKCGVSGYASELVAFQAPRNNCTGVDWRITFNNGVCSAIEFFPK